MKIELKNYAALAGNLTLQRGSITSNYWVLTIVHSFYSEADIVKFMIKLPPNATSDPTAAN